MIKFFKNIFYVSILFLLAISLFPGSLFGLLFYGDLNKGFEIIENTIVSINHTIVYFYISLLGFSIYHKNYDPRKILYIFFFLSVIFEIVHIVVPNRTFELRDLVGNILGVMVAYLTIKIYSLIIKI